MGSLKIREVKEKEEGRVFGTKPNFILVGYELVTSDFHYPIATWQRKDHVQFHLLIVSSHNW